MKSFLLDAFILATVFLNVTSGRSNVSNEHAIRKMLLYDYDATVLPPPSNPNKTTIAVEFGLKIDKLVKLDSKEELMTVDTWVVLSWNNSFFSWNPKDYGGMKRVQFKPSEIWFPDIVLYNNGDSTTPRAGGRTKFLSNVVVQSNGQNIWSGPASFTANCKLNLQAWPFDSQRCDLRFGSFSYGSNLLKLESFKTQSGRSGSYLANANWEVESGVTTKIGENDFGDCCPYKFSQISFTLKMERRSQYYLFYLVGPCFVLSMLTLISFCIPSESGERIGFVTTLLLGMMVFLLVVPQSLPQSSETIPVLGIVMMGTMVVITIALFATILVLRFFHSKGTPPKYLRRICKSSRRLEPKKIQVLESNDRDIQSDVSLNAMNLKEKSTNPNPVNPAGQEDAEVTWQVVASKLDKMFFWLFLVFIIIIYSILFGYR